MTSQNPRRWIADLCLLATAIMWGINILVVKYAVGAVEPLVFNSTRMIISTLVLGGLTWLDQRQCPADDYNGLRVRLVVFSLLSSVVYALIFMLGIKRTTAGNTALLMSSMPMWTAMLSFLFLRERLRYVTWVGLLITSAGTALVVGAKGNIDLSHGYFWGNLLVLSAAICWACATVVSSSLLRRIRPLRLAFISSLIATPIHVGISTPDLAESIPQLLETRMIYCLMYSGVLSTGVAYATWHYGVRQLGGSHASAYQNVVTLIGVVGGWVALHETPLLAQIVGGIVTAFGLFIVRRGRT